MEAPQILRQPTNWQDFESLCKQLWGEIWNCPEIQKNGRLGQDQSGVDVFGIPFNDDRYYGIQCKGKSEYTHSQFTEKEINDEIKKAIKFKPPLKKFYLATTALNDSKIQEFVRIKNLEHKAKGIFEVHLFAWETIVDLIQENRKTFNSYVRNINYKTTKSIALTFQNGHTEITCNPKFKKNRTRFIPKSTLPNDPMNSNSLFDLMQKQTKISNVIFVSKTFTTNVNLSYIPIVINIHNTGDDPIEEYKVFLEFEGEIQDLADTNEISNSIINSFSNYVPNTLLWPESLCGKIIPKKSILVGDDNIKSEEIFIKPFPKELEILIKWRLISKDFKDDGELLIKVLPDIEIESKTILIEDELKARFEDSEIEDYIIEKKEEEK